MTNFETDPKLPHNIDTEYALIGHVLCNNEIIGRLTKISPDDFYSQQHSDIWKAMQTIFHAENSISPFTILPLLPNPKIFRDAGGAINYLAGSISWTITHPYPADQEVYLIGLAQQRRLEHACRSIGGDPKDSARILMDAAESVMNEAPTDTIFDNFQITENILNDLKENKKPDNTGFKSLNEAMGGGLYPGKSYGVAARKKMGKTTLAGTISHNLNLTGVRHLFICGEMSSEEIQQRTLCRATDSYPSAFRTEYGKSDHFAAKIAQYAISMPRNTLFKNSPGLTFDEMKQIYTTAIDRHNIKGVILDYWQLVGGKAKNQSDAAHLDEVAQWIANYSRKRGVWSIVMAQINQDGNTRGGEGIRMAFDQVYNLQAPENDPSRSGRWLEMMETRYTKWMNIGSKTRDGFIMNEKGPYFEEVF
jgi:replicative DNA helicase